MAAFTVTLANGTGALGGSPSSGNWGSLTWNAFLWGYTLDLGLSVGKSITNSEAATTLLGFNVGKWLAETAPTDNTLGFDYLAVLPNTLALDGDMAGEILQDAAGYLTVFASNTTEAEDRDFPTWTEGSNAATTWAASATTGTTCSSISVVVPPAR